MALSTSCYGSNFEFAIFIFTWAGKQERFGLANEAVLGGSAVKPEDIEESVRLPLNSL